ncbi:SDR family oxidoreductase [Altericroceibacterium endophyticum]|uniref:SDR family oxidoreductase n=1 Tax=Altericroceibacterium endophyticum TaxID=1808508 RepID=A0A6I4T9H7_9SPHN|nr:SDR family oxidoreductase [Altericroceibacterium endophyticum]MXO67059.1 SDR family oxidoreductase [Altericroceibacterium endophyticum]
MRFESKNVLVLGGNSGIGLASVKGFAAEGADVQFTGRNQQTIDEAMQAVPGTQGHQVDITDGAAMDALLADMQASGKTLDVLFINAGVGGFAPLREITEEQWDSIHSINLKSCVFAIQKALPLLGKGSSIVVTGSIGAHIAMAGNAMYAAAKNGLHAAMKVIAGELVSEGIRVNMVSPGPIDTPLLYRNPGVTGAQVDALREKMIESVPMHRMGQAEEVARAVLFLASDEASFITAANLCVDGGAMELR